MTDPAESPVESVEWKRLDARVIWVDVVQTVLSLAPLLVGWLVLGVDSGLGLLIGIAAFGVIGAVTDAWRWTFTRYRITAQHVERVTGLFVRTERSVRRDLIRSVDMEAKLRHRIAGLRVIEVGAGQRAASGEAAFDLDAIRAGEAARLQQLLLGTSPVAPSVPEAGLNAGNEAGNATESALDGPKTDHGAAAANGLAGVDAATDGAEGKRTANASNGTGDEVLARFRPSWVVYNLFSIWVFVVAFGLVWGAQWFGSSLGFDLVAVVIDARDWSAIGWVWVALLGLAATAVVGVAAMAFIYFETNWKFELARVRTTDGLQLRTRQGLFTTREVHRDVARMRGVQIAEPVLWRWMGVTDTTVITTGLDEWSMSQPSAVIPRGPRKAATEVAAAVLEAPDDPLSLPLRVHPRAALRRRMWWAALSSALVTAVLAGVATSGLIPAVLIWSGPASLPLTLLAAWIAYRALGHALAAEHVVLRAGLVSRATAVLQRSAVSTIAVRESVLQRRLGLRTVSAMTAAGYGAYEAPDIDADDAVAFAVEAAPGLLEPFLIDDSSEPDDADSRGGLVSAHMR